MVLLGAAALASCERDGHRSRSGQADTHIVADVIARVGGRSIGAAEVGARMQSDGLSAEAALEGLIEEEVLVQEAQRLGFREDRESEREVERLMVRTMLRDFERLHTPASVSEAELREDYAMHAEKFQIPEGRLSWHILVKESNDEGRRRAESILREIREASDPRDVYDRYAKADSPPDLKAEDLPTISRKANIQKPYKDALFEAKAAGPLKKAVKTSYGWHAIVLAEIVPAQHQSLADVEEESRERLSQKNRFENLVEIVEGLRAQGLVVYDEAGVERLLTMAGLPERHSAD
jgi:hypothetical protein